MPLLLVDVTAFCKCRSQFQSIDIFSDPVSIFAARSRLVQETLQRNMGESQQVVLCNFIVLYLSEWRA